MKPFAPLVAATLWAWTGHAAAAPLTFVQAMAKANLSAPSLQAASLQIDAARSASRAAGELPDPKVSLGYTDFPISGPLAGRPDLDNFSMVTLGYEQDVPARAKRRARVVQALATIGEGEAALLAERRTVRVAAAVAWVDLAYAERKLDALQSLRRELQVDTTTADAQVASGASRPAAALEPDVASAGLQDRADALRAQLLKARAELGRWIGEEAAEAEPAGPTPAPRIDPAELHADLDQLPALAEKDAAVRRAEADATAARAETRPDWGYAVEYAHRDPRFGDYVSGKLKFSLPLFTANRQAPVIASRVSGVAGARADREATRRALAAALDGDLAEHAMHHALLERSRTVLVPLARRRAELETASYRGRTAALADVLTARRGVVDAELDALDREADTVRDGVRITLTYGEEPQ